MVTPDMTPNLINIKFGHLSQGGEALLQNHPTSTNDFNFGFSSCAYV